MRSKPKLSALAAGSSRDSNLVARGVLVIGAGPAGVAAAMRLHALGLQVLVVDRSAFPRSKVCGCCLNLAALSALATIHCDALVGELTPARLSRWRLSTSGRRIEASLPGGIALSRTRMDAALVAEAQKRGIDVRTPCEAKVLAVGEHAVTVRLSGQETPQCFGAVILASGLSGGGVARWLPWISQPSGPLGVGMVIDQFAGVERGTIHIACDQSGYVGLVRLEDGSIDVAAALRRPARTAGVAGNDAVSGEPALLAKASLIQAIDEIVHRAGLGKLPIIDPDALLTTPPLRRSRRPGDGRLLAVGDAAGYIEPFTGEGMAWAIRTGIAAAECLADQTTAANYGAAWTVRYAQMMRRRQWLCRMLSHTLASPTRSRWLVRAMTAAPWTVRYAVAQLNDA